MRKTREEKLKELQEQMAALESQSDDQVLEEEISFIKAMTNSIYSQNKWIFIANVVTIVLVLIIVMWILFA